MSYENVVNEEKECGPSLPSGCARTSLSKFVREGDEDGASGHDIDRRGGDGKPAEKIAAIKGKRDRQQRWRTVMRRGGMPKALAADMNGWPAAPAA